MVICPKCKKEIETANVVSKCWQKGSVDKNGKIVGYGSVEEVMDTILVECGNCGAEITNLVEDS